jgi:hypothetical protein
MMCQGYGCPIRGRCFRFVEQYTTFWATYGRFVFENHSCDGFVDVYETVKINGCF